MERFTPNSTPQHSYPLERPAYTQFISGLFDINEIKCNFSKVYEAYKFAAKRLKHKFSAVGIIKGIDRFQQNTSDRVSFYYI